MSIYPFTKRLAQMTADEAGTCVDLLDRGVVRRVPTDVYDDLLMVASGYRALFLDRRAQAGAKKTACAVCRRTFEDLGPLLQSGVPAEGG